MIDQWRSERSRRDRDDPAARIVRHTLLGPLHGGREQRLLHRVLTRVEAPVTVHERAEDLRRQRPQQVLVAVLGPHISSPDAVMSGRSSTAQWRASGQRTAISIARSGVSHSNRQ